MSKDLILVESPSKAKTINKYVGNKYIVEATVGHIKNLPKSKLGIDVENQFKTKFVTIRGKSDIIKKIKNLASKSRNIYVATDPDREGEAIAQDLVDILNDEDRAKVRRVLFNEITKNAVNKALENPLQIDDKLVSSQRARRVMDRIIGYQVSPFLWKAVIDQYGSSLSAGRVQSVALRLICEREEEIGKFIPTEYWSIIAIFKTERGEEFSAKLFEIEGKQLKIQPKPEMTDKEWEEFLKKNFAINSREIADKIISEIKNVRVFKISDINKRQTKRNPSPPFITSTLQVEASKRLGFRPRRTMMLAQQLYEGVSIGNEGLTGLITYMRTDSTRMSEEILNDARHYIKTQYGDEFLPDSPRTYQSKNKNVQDAHEAIRPTLLKYSPEYVKPYLDSSQYKLYELIWNRFIASQMEPALFENTTVSVTGDKFVFKATGSTLLFDGFLKVYDDSNGNEENNDTEDLKNIKIPAGLNSNQILALVDLKSNQHFTKPPARYTESSLIKELESKGIGRPSTYALIVGTILDRKYVESVDRKLVPTELGKKVNDILVKNFPNIFDVGFTAKMEDELDSIAEGENDYVQVLTDFYQPFSETLAKVESTLEKIKCEKCGSDMEVKIGRYGKFLACTNYPECKNIKSLKEISNSNNEPEYTGNTCPKCGGRTLYRESKFGRFIGCENYPECDYTEQITTGIKCPECGVGELIPKRTKRGRIFYSCSRYPDCQYATWKLPKEEEVDND